MCLLQGPLSGGPGHGRPVSCSERHCTTVITKVPRYIIRSNIVSGIQETEVLGKDVSNFWKKMFSFLPRHLRKRVNTNLLKNLDIWILES